MRLHTVITGVAGITLAAGSLLIGRLEGPFATWVWAVILCSVVCGILVLFAALTRTSHRLSKRNRRDGSECEACDRGPRRRILRDTPRRPTEYNEAGSAISDVAAGIGEKFGLSGRRREYSRWWLLSIVIAGLFFRISVLQTSRELSDDAARYHWDGKVLASGFNPYIYAPDDERLASLHTHAIDENINHPWVRTVYPPLAELLFAAAYLVSPGRLTGFQILGLLAELFTWLFLAKELARRALPFSYLLLIVWSPLMIFEGYLPGHIDILGLPFLVLFVTKINRQEPLTAGVFLGLACLIKPFPLIFLPAAIRELGLRRAPRLFVGLLITMVIFYLPFAGAGWKLFSSMWLMATAWSFNGSLGAILESMLPMGTAHLLSGLLLAVLLSLGTWKGKDLISRMLLAQAAFLICTPTLFPWYLMWMFPLLVLHPDPALLSLAILAPLTSEAVIRYRNYGIWEPALWPQIIEYAFYYSLLSLSAWRKWGMFGGRTSRSRRVAGRTAFL